MDSRRRSFDAGSHVSVLRDLHAPGVSDGEHPARDINNDIRHAGAVLAQQLLGMPHCSDSQCFSDVVQVAALVAVDWQRNYECRIGVIGGVQQVGPISAGVGQNLWRL